MRFIGLIFVCLISVSAEAGDLLNRGAIPFKAEGTIVIISPIREAPPHGLLNLFVGQQIESTKKNTKVKIIGKKTYGGFSGTNIWYQVENVNDLTATKNSPLWIYGGVEGKTQQIIINEEKGEQIGN